MRRSREQMFMGIARVVSERSTCCRLNVGAVIVGPHREILSVGYNGSAPGKAHCGGSTCQWYTPDGCKVIHAEYNALNRASYVVGSSIYITHSPCESCALLILQQQAINAVFYEIEYRITKPIDMLIASKIAVHRLLPSGYLLDKATGNVLEV